MRCKVRDVLKLCLGILQKCFPNWTGSLNCNDSNEQLYCTALLIRNFSTYFCIIAEELFVYRKLSVGWYICNSRNAIVHDCLLGARNLLMICLFKMLHDLGRTTSTILESQLKQRQFKQIRMSMTSQQTASITETWDSFPGLDAKRDFCRGGSGAYNNFFNEWVHGNAVGIWLQLGWRGPANSWIFYIYHV